MVLKIPVKSQVNSHLSIFWPQSIFRLPDRSSSVFWSCPCTCPSGPSITRGEILIRDPMKLMAEQDIAKKNGFLTSPGHYAPGSCANSRMNILMSNTWEPGKACASLQLGANLFSSAPGRVKQSREGASHATEKNKALS